MSPDSDPGPQSPAEGGVAVGAPLAARPTEYAAGRGPTASVVGCSATRCSPQGWSTAGKVGKKVVESEVEAFGGTKSAG